ncbi:hypothetical protein MNBD_GAMMA13-1152 [hydrothermal vent metagenome]|uniref:Uncharacterized protein n=1 Tax=hydrothermal vent metagenome TaxID=652676 RepID=A0A3B0Z5L8_9ZZZZ
MDALRQAETDDSPTPTTAESSVLEDTAVVPTAAVGESLQLEPMDNISASENVLVNTPDQDVANDTDTDSSPNQEDARRAAHSIATKHSPLKKQAFYILAGFATAGFILSAYYFWQSNKMAALQGPHSATLLAAPEIPASENITEKISTTVPEPVNQIAKTEPENLATTTYPTTSPEEFSTPVAAAVSRSNTVTPATTGYKIEIHKRPMPRAIPQQLKQAYQAYQSKDYPQAERLYRQVLRRYPDNRDALLGLAAIALYQGNHKVAHYYYSQIIKTDPGDKIALLAIRSLNGEQYQLENGSQIKQWLQSDRSNAALHFALGNQHAANARWKEAQQAYFEAYRLQPKNADFAFNLAISLDQLSLREKALEYYLRAKALSGSSAAQFSSSRIDRRINQLRNQVEQNS